MDLQGVGALAAAAVAAVGIPAALLVGRWQMRAALRTAETTYRAALDAVRADAANTHTQWQRSARRDAYAAFLSTAGDLKTRSMRLRYLNPRDEEAHAALLGELGEFNVALNSQLLIIKLEGPPEVASKADWYSTQVHAYVRRERRCYEEIRAWTKLLDLVAAHDPEQEAARALQASLEALERAVTESNFSGSYEIVEIHDHNGDEDVPEPVTTAYRVAQNAYADLPSDTFTEKDHIALFTRCFWDEERIPMPQGSHFYAYIMQAEAKFIASARTALSHSDVITDQ
ncbi:hypothetical protein [Streptomyces canus]|uniref:hypothetical protein n=1 Tax=Streptomyces canus TaxID=58343 RepID=UPI0027862F26|nr:hypothetical protein [Streptomyces canus]MDQ0761977.1 hypothetical protein [Streptomyces canus]